MGSSAASIMIWTTRPAATTSECGVTGMLRTELTLCGRGSFYGGNLILKRTKTKLSMMALGLILSSFIHTVLRAEDAIETAGEAVGMTASNLLFLPLKAISMSIRTISSALSYLVTGGNANLTKQIW